MFWTRKSPGSPSPSRRELLAGGGLGLAAFSLHGAAPEAPLRVRKRLSGAPGHEVILGRSDEHYPRHSEGDLAQLADGTLFAVWERHTGADDHATAILVGRRSTDAGMTWGPLETVASLDEAEHRTNSNIMSASLLRLRPSNQILLAYLGKEETESGNTNFRRKIRCSVWVRRSADGRRFSKPVRITDRDHYYVVNNARVIQLSNGRILAPAAVSLEPGQELGWEKQSCLTFYSDDAGESWRKGGSCTLRPADFPGRSAGQITLQEPGLIELKDGRVFMVIRTRLGHPYRSISSDGGETWSVPEPIAELTAPASPQTLFRLPRSRHIAMVYNNNPGSRFEDRHPLSFAVSADEGKSFRLRKVIQDLPARTFDYVSARVIGDQVYLAYREWQVGNDPTLFLTDFKLLITPVSWFEAEG